MMYAPKMFTYEFAVYNFIAAMILFLEELMDKAGWTMSPSRFYRMIYETISWCRVRKLWHFGQPAFLYVMEQCMERAEKLKGTHDDESRVMKMGMWRDRKPPIPGGNFSILQIFDWFLPILRLTEAKMVEYFGNPDETANGNKFTLYEALNTVFLIVDRLYKDPRFGEINNWGQPKAYPWVAFVRDEMYQWREAMKPTFTPPGTGDPLPFSMG
jgi:hypothetical protein